MRSIADTPVEADLAKPSCTRPTRLLAISRTAGPADGQQGLSVSYLSNLADRKREARCLIVGCETFGCRYLEGIAVSRQYDVAIGDYL